MSSTHEAIAEEVKDWRLREGLANASIIKRLQEKYGYSKVMCYMLIKAANMSIVEQYKETNASALEERIEELNQLAEEAREMKNHKLVFQIKQEISKLQGLHIERIELKQHVINVVVPDETEQEQDGDTQTGSNDDKLA